MEYGLVLGGKVSGTSSGDEEMWVPCLAAPRSASFLPIVVSTHAS